MRIELGTSTYTVDGVAFRYCKRRRRKSVKLFADRMIAACGDWPFPTNWKFKIFAGKVVVHGPATQFDYWLHRSNEDLAKTFNIQMSAELAAQKVENKWNYTQTLNSQQELKTAR